MSLDREGHAFLPGLKIEMKTISLSYAMKVFFFTGFEGLCMREYDKKGISSTSTVKSTGGTNNPICLLVIAPS